MTFLGVARLGLLGLLGTLCACSTDAVQEGSAVVGASGGVSDDKSATGAVDPGAGDPGAATGVFDVLRAAADRAKNGNGPRAVRAALSQGAGRLAALQADTIGDNARNGLDDTDPDDGGWDFIVPPSATSHTAARSPTNLFGEIGLGPWAAIVTDNAGNRALTTMLDAGIAMQRDPDIDSPPDFIFGVLLAELADNPGFAQVARAHYDARIAANGSAAGFATLIRDSRHARNEDGLIPYDIGWLTLSAAALDFAFPGAGYAADAATYAGIVVDDLESATPRFDIDNPAEGFYIIGLGWAQIAATWVGDGALLTRARNRLLAAQQANGAWGTGATPPTDDLQATATALETLALTDLRGPPAGQAERRAARFLIAEQAANGGWPDAMNNELPLVDAEIMLGLMLARTRVGDDGIVPGAPLVAVAHASAVPAAAAPLE